MVRFVSPNDNEVDGDDEDGSLDDLEGGLDDLVVELSKRAREWKYMNRAIQLSKQREDALEATNKDQAIRIIELENTLNLQAVEFAVEASQGHLKSGMEYMLGELGRLKDLNNELRETMERNETQHSRESQTLHEQVQILLQQLAQKTEEVESAKWALTPAHQSSGRKALGAESMTDSTGVGGARPESRRIPQQMETQNLVGRAAEARAQTQPNSTNRAREQGPTLRRSKTTAPLPHPSPRPTETPRNRPVTLTGSEILLAAARKVSQETDQFLQNKGHSSSLNETTYSNPLIIHESTTSIGAVSGFRPHPSQIQRPVKREHSEDLESIEFLSPKRARSGNFERERASSLYDEY